MKNKEWLAENINNMLKNQNYKLHIGQTIRVSCGDKKLEKLKLEL
jgi:hypothetical protein